MKRRALCAWPVFGATCLNPQKTGLGNIVIRAEHGGEQRGKSPGIRLEIGFKFICIGIEADPFILDKSQDVKLKDLAAFEPGVRYVSRNCDLFLRHYRDKDFSFDDEALFQALRQRQEYKEPNENNPNNEEKGQRTMSYQLYQEPKQREDNAPEKRVELHLHTNMSEKDGVSSVESFIRRAAEFGHKAIAVTDPGGVQAFPDAQWAAHRYERNKKILYGMEARLQGGFSEENASITILAKNQEGLKNLYRLITWSNLENRRCGLPCLTKEKIREYRRGLVLGSGCAQGELFRAIMDHKPWETLREIAAFYDYLEIFPVAGGENEMRINKIVLLGKELSVPVCAVGDARYCDPEDEVYRRILLHPEEEEEPARYLRTTEEMLAAFSFLGEKEAYETVVTNPGLIADKIEEIEPIRWGLHPPAIEKADREPELFVRRRAGELYGDPLPEIVSERLERELQSIRKNGFSGYYVIAKSLVENSEARGYHTGFRGAVGSSFVAFLLGITEVDPLPPHYLCPACKHAVFLPNGTVGSGFDLPERACPVCSCKMKGDGHNIPFETFAGFFGDKRPDIDLNFAVESLPDAQNRLRSVLGVNKVFRAGTVALLSEKAARQFVKDYAKDHRIALDEEETALLAQGLTGAKLADERHPGKFVIIPDGSDAEDFTPLQYSAESGKQKEIITHFPFFDLYDSCMTVDLLGHTALDLLHHLEAECGIKARDIPMNDPAVIRLFAAPDGIPSEKGERDPETHPLPETDSPYMRKMMELCKPEHFSDLVQIFGLSRGTGVWLDNAQNLIKKGVCTLKDVPALRDDIMNALTEKGVDKKTAFDVMEKTRKGRADGILTDEVRKHLLDRGVPTWYIDSLKKIRYLFPKAHAVSYMICAFRLAWFKLYHPEEYEKACREVYKEQ